MHLVAGIPASPAASPGDKPGIGHLTPMDAGWLLGLVFEVNDKRLIANHLVAAHEASPSVKELAARIRAVGEQLKADAAPGSVTAAHVLDATMALEAFVHQAGAPRDNELSERQLHIAFHLLGDDLEKTIYVGDVAAACGTSEGHFRRAFRLCTGVSPQQWRQERRIRYCRRQLAESDEPLANIARRAGFAAQSHFSRVFSQLTGMSPSEWRRIVRPFALTRNVPTLPAANLSRTPKACA